MLRWITNYIFILSLHPRLMLQRYSYFQYDLRGLIFSFIFSKLMDLLERKIKSETFYNKSLILLCILALFQVKQINMLMILFHTFRLFLIKILHLIPFLLVHSFIFLYVNAFHLIELFFFCAPFLYQTI